MLSKKLPLSVALLILIQLIFSTSVYAIGSFSVFRTCNLKSVTRPSPLPKAKYGILGDSYQETIKNTNISAKEVTFMIKDLIRSTSSGMCGGISYLRKEGSLVVSLPQTFTWNHVGFKLNSNLQLDNVIRSTSNCDIVKLEFLSCGTAQNRGTIMVQFSLQLRNNTMHIVRRQSTSGVSDKVVSKVVTTITNMLVKDITREISLRAARSKQMKAGKLLSDAAAKSRKRIELDRIINPEKYRTKSATVRRADGDRVGSSSGRYTPSAATQARRSKSRGG